MRTQDVFWDKCFQEYFFYDFQLFVLFLELPRLWKYIWLKLTSIYWLKLRKLSSYQADSHPHCVKCRKKREWFQLNWSLQQLNVFCLHFFVGGLKSSFDSPSLVLAKVTSFVLAFVTSLTSLVTSLVPATVTSFSLVAFTPVVLFCPFKPPTVTPLVLFSPFKPPTVTPLVLFSPFKPPTH